MITRTVRRTTPRSHISSNTRSTSLSPGGHSSSSSTSFKKSKTVFGTLQTILLLISLLFNCILIYWATEPYLTKSRGPLCPLDKYDPHSQDPCNPEYLAKILETNPHITDKLQRRGIISNSPRLSLEQKKQSFTAKNKNNRQTNRGRGDGVDYDGGTPEILQQNEIGNKNQYKQHIRILTESLPSSMSLVADVNKRELSWMSPLSRDVAPLHRPNPELYITSGEKEIWFDNRLFVFEDAKVAFCVMEKNSCSMFKQIFKRIRGKNDYLSTDYTKIHYLPYRGLADISFNEIPKLNRVMNDDEFYFAAFVREPLERLVSGYIDKCDKKRGVNLCDYARWSPYFKEKYGSWSSVKSGFTPEFDIWAHGLFHCPCWPETDWHFAPQFNFCNLYQYADKYDVFRFENRTHRKVWMERAGFWDKFGKSGWKDGGNDGVSIVDYGPKSHSSTGGSASKYIAMYAKSNPDIIAAIIDHYRNDYILFGIQMPDWMCDESIPINDNVKRALRTLPRTSRPPCDNYKWLWERE